MSRLEAIDVGDFVTQYGLSGFVETGLQHGKGLARAMEFPFEKLVSIEIHQRFITSNSGKSRDPRVTLLLGKSVDMLPTAIELIGDRRILWWLDAHLPAKYTSKSMKTTPGMTYPLQPELETILGLRDCSRDVFLLDDMHFYRTDWIKEKYGDPGSVDDVRDMLKETHTLSEHKNVLSARPIKE